MIKIYFFLLLCFCAVLSAKAQKNYDIKSYGALVSADNNSPAIQKAIDAAHAAGGGRVVIPEGRFVSGPLMLKSNVELHLQKHAFLMGSAKIKDYGPGRMALILADGQQNIAVTGAGTIDGQAHELVFDITQQLHLGKIKDDLWRVKRTREENRTNLIYFYRCQKIKITGIKLKDASSWVQYYKECQDMLVDSINVFSTAYWNNDGIDVVDCKNVKITNSFFNAADDAICLKSEIPNGVCENVLIENCTLRSSANGFKLGTASLGGFKNITARNLTVFDTYRAAIALETVDGGRLENVNISHVRATNTGNAIFIRLGHRNTDSRFSAVENVVIEDVKVEVPAGKPDVGYPIEGPLPKVAPHNLVPASIVGLPGHKVKNVTLKNIEIGYGGGASKEKAYVSIDSLNSVTENAAGYPEFTMFGELPSWGFYVRHAEGIKFDNVKVKLDGTDFRPALVFDDVDGVTLNKVAVPQGAPLPAVVYKGVSKLNTSALTLPAGSNAVVNKP